jgi:hypothetical protein
MAYPIKERNNPVKNALKQLKFAQFLHQNFSFAYDAPNDY